MIEQGDYKLIMYPYAHTVRLYNMKKDPEEMNDLAKNPEYARVVARLKSEFKKLQVEMDDPLDVDNPAPLKKKKKGRHGH
jgi:choline-sulfatase